MLLGVHLISHHRTGPVVADVIDELVYLLPDFFPTFQSSGNH